MHQIYVNYIVIIESIIRCVIKRSKEFVRSDKGSGAVVLNRRDYEKSIKNLINDKTKFKELTEDVRERTLSI